MHRLTDKAGIWTIGGHFSNPVRPILSYEQPTTEDAGRIHRRSPPPGGEFTNMGHYPSRNVFQTSVHSPTNGSLCALSNDAFEPLPVRDVRIHATGPATPGRVTGAMYDFCLIGNNADGRTRAPMRRSYRQSAATNQLRSPLWKGRFLSLNRFPVTHVLLFF